MRKLTHKEIKSTRPEPEEARQSKRFPVVVLLENIRSLYNVGAMFRTCDGVAVEKLYLCGYTGYPPRKELDKTSLGSVESVPWEYHEDSLSCAKSLKDQGYTLCALEHTEVSKLYTEALYRYPICLCLGNEVEGLTQELLDMCHMAVEIPMYGMKQSLNVTVAGGVLLYHLVDHYLKHS